MVGVEDRGYPRVWGYPLCGAPGGSWAAGGAVLGGQRGAGYRWASAIDLIYRIKMVVARASGTVMASSLEQKNPEGRFPIFIGLSYPDLEK